MVPAATHTAVADPSAGRHAAVLGAILLVGVAVQAVAITRATVPGLDAVSIVEAAQRIDRVGLTRALESGQRHPLFPASVAGAHRVMEAALGPRPWLWAMSVQATAGLALVLTALPLAGLTGRLVGRRAAWMACGALVVLPKVAELGPYGIGDSLHLFLFTTAVWACVAGLSETSCWRSAGWWAMAGVSTALALLTRAESVVLAGVTVGLLLVLAARTGATPRPRSALAGLGIYLLALGMVFGSAMAVTRPPSLREAFHWALGWGERESQAAAAVELRLKDEPPEAFAVKEPSQTLRQRGVVAALRQYILSLGEVFWYVPGVLAVVGYVRLARRRSAGDRLCRVLFVVYSLIAIAYASEAGYLRPRHLAPLVVLALPCLLPGWAWTMNQLERWSHRGRRSLTERSRFELGPLGWSLAVLLAAGCALWAVEPLQARQTGYREAASWLHDRHSTEGIVLDSRGWTGLYSGWSTFSYRDARHALANARLAYVVVTYDELQASSNRAQTLRQLLAQRGRLVARFPLCPQNAPQAESVLVYRWCPGIRPPPQCHPPLLPLPSLLPPGG